MKSAIVVILLFIPSSLVIAQRLPAAGNAHPNIILINLDDADAGMLSPDVLDIYYPAIRELSQGAIRFTNAHATTPFCAPSRAALMRGQYAFNTGIKVHDPLSPIANGFAGSYTEFLARGYQNDVLCVWLKQAGYRTMHIGKYHHRNFDFQVPPGWDDFVVNAGARYYSTTRFTNKDDPNGVRYNTGPDNYLVDLDAADAIHFVNTHLASNPGQPFFLYLAPLAPHLPTAGLPVTDMVKREYADYPVPQFPAPPSFNELDMSDKPWHLQTIPLLTTSQIDDQVTIFESRARAMKSVDDLIATITVELPQSVLDNSWIFLTSDNGYQLGQHRMTAKQDAYDATTRVPLFVKGPGTATMQANHLLAHIDICPTILELAGAPIPTSVDAKSFKPLLDDPQAFDERHWQAQIMIENWSQKNDYGVITDTVYTGLRAYDSVFVNWANGENEFYDLNADPFQMDNSFDFLDVASQTELATRLGAFRMRPVDPITTITSPASAYILPRELELRGLCEDDRGVDDVLTTIQSATTARYWNGTQWQEQPIEISFDPVAPGQLLSLWRMEQSIETDTNSGLDVLVVSARSMDVEGNVAETGDSAEFFVDSQDPVATYRARLKDGAKFIEGDVELSGFYRDNFNVSRVDVTIIDLSTGWYWDGDAFQTDWQAVPAGLTKGKWSLEPKLPPGVYECQLQPVDEAGNAPPPESLFFGVQKWRK